MKPLFLTAVVGTLVRRLEANPLFRRLGIDAGLGPAELQPNYPCGGIFRCQLAKLRHFTWRPGFPLVAVVFCHFQSFHNGCDRTPDLTDVQI